MSYLGIDPGKNGGIVVIDPDDDYVDYRVIPSTELDLGLLLKDMNDNYFIDFACIEKVSSSPQMGVVSAFTFGRGYGSLITAVSMLEIPLELVRPQVWQRYLKIPPRKVKRETRPQFKKRLRAEAQRLFPKLSIWKEKKSLGKQKAICDALLLAEYCRRTNR